MLTGRRARNTTWLILDDFIDQHASDAAPPKATKKIRARSPAKKPAAKRPAKSVQPVVDESGEPVIGANKERRFSSASSRSLAGGRSKRDAG